MAAALVIASPLHAQDVPTADRTPGSAAMAAPPAANTDAVDAPSPARRHAKGDPWEGLNRELFSIQQGFDRAVFRPVAMGYATIVPKPVRTGFRHLISHIGEPIVFLHDLLQLKPKRAARTLARFLINTTAGVGGLLDVAKTAKLPHRPNGLGNTLARYGVGPGPYIFLPLVGPTDLRDLFGGQVDGLVYPVAIGSPFNRIDYQVAKAAVGGLDLRAESDANFKALLDGAADPYATLRSVFQQNRRAEIAEMNGRPVDTGGLDDPLVDPEAGSDTPAASDAGSGATTAEPPADDPAKVPPADEKTPDPAPPLDAVATTGAAGLPTLIAFF